MPDPLWRSNLCRCLVLPLVLAVMCGGLLGCAGKPRPSAELAQAVPPYPIDAQVGPDLDVVVVRSGGQIELVNRTPRAYESVVLWLNGQFVRPVDRVAIGSNPGLPLREFVNGYGEGFPTGSFLRPERSAVLVLAELYDPQVNVRHRLVVQPPGTR